MNGPLHPLIAHLPLGLAAAVPLVAIAVLIGWYRGWLAPRSWALVILLQLMLTGGALAALQSGEADEERVEKVVGAQPIHQHEEAASVFFWASLGLLVAMAVVPTLKQERNRRALALVCGLATLLVLLLALRTGAAGGELVYQHGAARALGPDDDARPPPPPRSPTDEDAPREKSGDARQND